MWFCRSVARFIFPTVRIVCGTPFLPALSVLSDTSALLTSEESSVCHQPPPTSEGSVRVWFRVGVWVWGLGLRFEVKARVGARATVRATPRVKLTAQVWDTVGSGVGALEDSHLLTNSLPHSTCFFGTLPFVSDEPYDTRLRFPGTPEGH